MASSRITTIDNTIYSDTLFLVDISYDPAKRDWTLEHRGLDFADAGAMFARRTATRSDTRHTYGEDRFVTAGFLNGRCVAIAWTPRGGGRRIISMRHVHADEQARWFPRDRGPG